ncbi:hypothetical protein ABT256_15985 [Amycolatopsis japonica]|uniref:hypothetical protein n=1 Tax=Amycolatopsis japonica TaxID=208439 RepID=UPI0033271EAB
MQASEPRTALEKCQVRAISCDETELAVVAGVSDLRSATSLVLRGKFRHRAGTRSPSRASDVHVPRHRRGNLTVSESIYDGTSFIADELTPAMNLFEEALTYRWRIDAAQMIRFGADLPVRPHDPVWDYKEELVRTHINAEDCAYLKWVDDGQVGDVSEVEHHDELYFACGVDTIMQQIASWAAEERAEIFGKLPYFDAHDMGRLRETQHALVGVAKLLGQGYEEAPADSRSHGDLTLTVTDMSSDNLNKDWWVTWSGMAAEAAKSGFFHSVGPTLHYQRYLAGCMANLYSLRAGAIEMARRNTLKTIVEATSAFDDTRTETVSYEGAWTVVNGAAVTMAMIPYTAPAGAVVGLVGFLGSELLSESSFETYAQSVDDILREVKSKIASVSDDLYQAEWVDYLGRVQELRDEIATLPSAHLELYDFTRNPANGDPKEQRESRFTVEIADVLDLAAACYDAAVQYEEPLAKLLTLDGSDPDLADQGGKRILPDQWLIDLRDSLVSFVKTTCARYQEAGHQVKAAAIAYARSDADAVDQMEPLHDHLGGDLSGENDGYWAKTKTGGTTPDLNGDDEPGRGGDTEDHVEGTDRSEIEPLPQHGPETEMDRGPKDDVPDPTRN